VRRFDAGLPGLGGVRAVLGDQREPVQWVDPGLLHADRDLRAVYLERAVFGHDAGVQYRDAHVPRVRRGRRVRRFDAGVPDVGGVRAVLGDQREPVRRFDAGLLHARRDLRTVYLERAVRRLDPDLQHDDAHVPRVRRGRRVRRFDAGLSAGRLVRAVLGDERHLVHGRDARMRHGQRDLRAVHVERAVRGDDAGLQPGDAHLPRLRRRRRVQPDGARVSVERVVRAVLGDERNPLHGRHARLLRRGRDLRPVLDRRAVWGDDAGL
jgi:hypothetical protein